jgi:hypothetical protein
MSAIRKPPRASIDSFQDRKWKEQVYSQLQQSVGPQGPTGPAGPANTLSIGTVTSGASPSATITGTAPNQTLNLVLVPGDTGPAGPSSTQVGGYDVSLSGISDEDVLSFNASGGVWTNRGKVTLTDGGNF